MTITAPKPDDVVVLSADDCLYHRGPLAYTGVLSLTGDALRFNPTKTIDRLTGAEDVLIPIDIITELSSGGINHNLDVVTTEGTHRLSGRGALRVHARLVSLLAEEDSLEGEPLMFEPGERVLLQGRAEHFVNDVMAVRGELTVTDRRFRFFSGLGIDRVFWNSTKIDVPITAIQKWELKGLRRRLHLQLPDTDVIVGGALTSQLFNILELLLGEEDDSQVADELALDTWEVSLRRGPIAHPGELLFTVTHMQFTPTSVLDTIVGVKPVRFAIRDITRISIRGWPERKLIIRVGHEVFAFNVADVQDRFEAIRHLVRDRHYQLAVRGQGGPPRYQTTVDSWSTKVGYQHGDQIVIGTFVMEQVSEFEVRFGWLLLLRTRVLFLPLGGPASREKQMEFPLEEVCRLDGGPRSRQDQILMSTDKGRARYLISDRDGVVEDFWSQCRSPTRILAWETLGPRSTSRIMGKCRFIRIMTHGDTVVDLSPGMTVEHPSGVAIVLPGEPGSSVPIDTWVTVEIGQSEGIYQLDSKVVRSVPTPLEGVIANPEGTHMLIVDVPNEVRVYNQREGYRVTTEVHLKAQMLAQTADGGSWMATGETFDGTIVDLSIGGCAMDSGHELAAGNRINLNLPLLDQWVDLRATCVRLTDTGSADKAVRYGLEFRELSMAQEDILHKAVLAMQREVLSDDEDGDGVDAEDDE